MAAAALRVVARRLLAVRVGTGVACCVALGLCWLILATVIDYRFDLPFPIRVVGVAGLVIGIAAVVFRAAWVPAIPVGRREDQLALLLERAFGSLGGRLIAAVQLARAETVPRPILAALNAETAALLKALPLRRAVSLLPLNRSLGFALAAFACAAGLATIPGFADSLVLVRRAFLADEPIPRRTRFLEMCGDQVVAVGDDLHLALRATGILPASGTLRLKDGRGTVTTLDLTPSSETPGRYTRLIQNLQESYTATIELGDNRSAPFRIEAVPRPLIRSLVFRERFAPYTGWAPERRPPGRLRLTAGSELEIELAPDRPVASISAIPVSKQTAVSGGESAPTSPAASGAPATPATALPLLQDPSGGPGAPFRVTIAIRKETAPGLTFTLRDSRGIESRGLPTYPLEIVPDAAPTLRLLWPVRREELATRDSRFLIAFQAADDFGLESVRLHFAVDWQEGTAWRTLELAVDEDRPVELARQYDWDLARLTPALQEGQILTFWLEARDANSVTGPGLTTSEKYQIRIVSAAEKRDELARRLSEAVQGLESLKTDQETASRKLQEIVATELRQNVPMP
jgi:hypothetical protein